MHKLIAEDVLEILEKLYDAGYPIERMILQRNILKCMKRNNKFRLCF
ncbi:MAG: hypothetical protein IJ593_02610 [Lachnospiraceae bacterium]|nr:hypothetical protein [Lachnospiraceae bacterium]